LLPSTLVGNARSFTPETLHRNHAMDSSLQIEDGTPVDEKETFLL